MSICPCSFDFQQLLDYLKVGPEYLKAVFSFPVIVLVISWRILAIYKEEIRERITQLREAGTGGVKFGEKEKAAEIIEKDITQDQQTVKTLENQLSQSEEDSVKAELETMIEELRGQIAQKQSVVDQMRMELHMVSHGFVNKFHRTLENVDKCTDDNIDHLAMLMSRRLVFIISQKISDRKDFDREMYWSTLSGLITSFGQIENYGLKAFGLAYDKALDMTFSDPNFKVYWERFRRASSNVR